MHKKKLHPNAADFQLKKKEKRKKEKEEKEEQDLWPAIGFAALTVGEFVGFFFGFSYGFGDF
jgi:hypothetical protein